MTWIERVIHATRESESPPKYFLWSAITALAAVMKDSVYLDRGGLYQLYPNVYTILIGPSGIKKGVPVNVAKKLVQEVNNTRLLSGRLTIQKAISILSKGHTDEITGKVVGKDAHAFLVASEFASFIVQDPAALTILTDLYDTHYHRPRWVNYTKKDDQEILNHPCISLMGASNEIHFKEAVPMNALGGGFVARTFLVVSSQRGKLNPLTEKKAPIDYSELIEYLREVASLTGEFQWTNAAKEIYDKWYMEFGDTERNDETGVLNRVTDSVLKVAMCLSVSRDLDMMIQSEDIQYAIRLCEDTVTGIRKVTMGSGSNKLGPQTATVIRYLLACENYEATKEQVLSKHWGHFDSYDLERIIENLAEMKAIHVLGKKYRLAEKIIKNYEEKIVKKKENE